MVMSHTQEFVFLCMLNFFMLVQSSADGPGHVGALFCLIVAKHFMLKVCIQSVHHGGIKDAMVF